MRRGQWGYAICNSWVSQIQSPDLPAQEDNVGEWIEEMKEEWRHDVEVLKAWVAKATKK